MYDVGPYNKFPSRLDVHEIHANIDIAQGY